MNVKDSELNLDDERILSAAEACDKWGIENSTLRKAIDRFPKGTIRKFGKQWVVTKYGMDKVFGNKND
ncbi:helix-turn-helix domain-containing protein [Paenibacillus tianjinensis]|uniref:Helix-turn-helix domain-containing protein n=1 Tax=Paenibacillus tianjinensis TaxID=2810347 RepID=A0ABX7L5V4_9BACL|nr:helix-turn-helix domain-containing protein [Paenibacillus tianjinensis]QSF43493.1 hypothetical protein JRJ22_19715 [Paenibacillus tianjinensis]